MLYQEFRLPDAETLNARLYGRYLDLSAAGRVSRTHHIGGRYENTYIALADIPELGVLLEVFRQQAGHWLGMPVDSLRAGFWFNAMEHGQRTSLHHHDENDELLSAAYYIRVPEHSGTLVLHDGDDRVPVRPQAGKLVMFAPSLWHEVTVNESHALRLSVGMNIGPAESA
jgi:hypothetical protein